MYTVLNLETFSCVFVTKLNHFFLISGSFGGLCMLTLSFNLLEQKLKKHMSVVLLFFFRVSSLAILSAWNLASKREIQRRETILWRCKAMWPQSHMYQNICTEILKMGHFGAHFLATINKKVVKSDYLKSIFFYKLFTCQNNSFFLMPSIRS